MPASKSKVKVENSKIQAKSQKSEKVAKVAKKDTLALDVYDVKGKVIGSVDLPKEVFGSVVNKQLIAQAVRVYLANQRAGTASTKTRGEVRGSTRKIYRQKGTGRARHGASRAPIFVHGGIALGPKPRDYSLSMPKKMRKKALFSALSAKVKDNGIKVVSGIEELPAKTKEMASVLKNLQLSEKKAKILLVLPSVEGFDSVIKASRNIQGVTYRSVSQINTYEILNNTSILFAKGAIEALQNGGDK